MPKANRKINLTQSVLKALDILECLASADQSLSAQEVAQQCGMSRPTAYRLLNTLLARDFVKTCQENGRYHLGSRVLSLSKAFLEHLDLPELAKPHMRDLSQVSKETVHLAVLDDTELLYIGKVDSLQSVHMHCTVGARNPLYCTALGKAILAFLPEEERDGLLERIDFIPRTPYTVSDRAALVKNLESVRNRGFAVDDMEIEEGIRCVGAPIFNHAGQPIAAISVSGPAFRLTESRLPELGELVLCASVKISHNLGYIAGDPLG